MIPLRDELRSHTVPYVNYLVIGMNILIYLFSSLPGEAFFEQFTYQFGLIPAQLTGGVNVDSLTDLFTSMFMHGGLLHLAGNMLYLWIFGDNVEDAMGHAGYLIFYLLGGLLAALTHIFLNPASVIPTVGASGAIAAVLGAYAVLYPGSHVYTLIPLGFFVRIAAVPAVIVLGLWFLLQLLEGVLSLGMPADMGGIAFWAHIGGFVAGMLLCKLFAKPRTRYGGPLY